MALQTADLADMRVQIFRGFYEDFTQIFCGAFFWKPKITQTGLCYNKVENRILKVL